MSKVEYEVNGLIIEKACNDNAVERFKAYTECVETITIREARKSAKLTQVAMGKLLDIPVRTIQEWEAGNRKCPGYVRKLVIDKLEQYKKYKDIDQE